MQGMGQRESATRRVVRRGDKLAATPLASPTDRIVRDEWSEVTDRLRQLNAAASHLGNQLNDLLATIRKLPL